MPTRPSSPWHRLMQAAGNQRPQTYSQPTLTQLEEQTTRTELGNGEEKRPPRTSSRASQVCTAVEWLQRAQRTKPLTRNRNDYGKRKVALEARMDMEQTTTSRSQYSTLFQNHNTIRSRRLKENMDIHRNSHSHKAIQDGIE